MKPVNEEVVKVRNVLVEYLHHLENSDCDKLIQLFADDGIVNSPLYGEENATTFFPKLLAKTQSSTLSPHQIFHGERDSSKAALHFTYEWTLTDGKVFNFECVDLFKLNEEHRITEMRILYDASEVKEVIADSQS
jgi:ketosteroid isomerase-like protein